MLVSGVVYGVKGGIVGGFLFPGCGVAMCCFSSSTFHLQLFIFINKLAFSTFLLPRCRGKKSLAMDSVDLDC